MPQFGLVQNHSEMCALCCGGFLLYQIKPMKGELPVEKVKLRVKRHKKHNMN
jgi:hypothetical protein